MDLLFFIELCEVYNYQILSKIKKGVRSCIKKINNQKCIQAVTVIQEKKNIISCALTSHRFKKIG